MKKSLIENNNRICGFKLFEGADRLIDCEDFVTAHQNKIEVISISEGRHFTKGQLYEHVIVWFFYTNPKQNNMKVEKNEE